MAPAPADNTTSSIGANALTNAGTLSAVYFINPAASPGVTLPKIRAALIATETTWITEVISLPSGTTLTSYPILYPNSCA